MDPSGVPLDAPSPGGPSRKKAEVDYKFCLLCSNLLYPKEDRMTNTLNYICKACGQVQPAEASCTYRNQLGSTVTETAGVTTDVANDPTVGTSPERHDPSHCSRCGELVTCNRCGKNLLVKGKSKDEEAAAQEQYIHDSSVPETDNHRPQITRAEMPRLQRALAKARAELPRKYWDKVWDLKIEAAEANVQLMRLTRRWLRMAKGATAHDQQINELKFDTAAAAHHMYRLQVDFNHLKKECKALDHETINVMVIEVDEDLQQLTESNDVLHTEVMALSSNSG